MRRALQVRIAFMGAFALIAMQGCADSTYQHCVDENGLVVNDSNCEADAGTPRPLSSGPVAHYRWWYGGQTALGRHVAGGSYVAPPHGSGSVARASAVSRGIFGRPGGMAHGFGGGHGVGS